MISIQPNSWLNSLVAILAAIGLATVTPIQVNSVTPVASAQSVTTEYDKYMRQGYAATASRDYRTALINFRRALSLRSGDRYATNAIRNVSSYARRGQKIASRPLPIGTGSPGNRVGAGTRGTGVCLSGEKQLTALVPETESGQTKAVLGLTTAEYPILFFYVPSNSGELLELVIIDVISNQKYDLSLTNPKNPGVVGVNLSSVKGLPPLAVGQNYQWYFSIVCDSQDRSQDRVVDGYIQRVKPDSTLVSELQKTAPHDRVFTYFANGLWYDSLATLAQLRQANPQDASLADEWANLLGGIGLDNIANEPLLQPSTPTP